MTRIIRSAPQSSSKSCLRLKGGAVISDRDLAVESGDLVSLTMVVLAWCFLLADPEENSGTGSGELVVRLQGREVGQDLAWFGPSQREKSVVLPLGVLAPGIRSRGQSFEITLLGEDHRPRFVVEALRKFGFDFGTQGSRGRVWGYKQDVTALDIGADPREAEALETRLQLLFGDEVITPHVDAPKQG